MKNLIVVITVFCFLPMGCATFSDQARMEAYGRTMDSYATAMRLSDYQAACRYVDPSTTLPKACLKRYENLKIVSYDVLRVTVANDKREVSQTVEVEYYFLDRYVVKKLQHEQSWRYQENLEQWVLRTGPPHFE